MTNVFSNGANGLDCFLDSSHLVASVEAVDHTVVEDHPDNLAHLKYQSARASLDASLNSRASSRRVVLQTASSCRPLEVDLHSCFCFASYESNCVADRATVGVQRYHMVAS